VTGNLLENCTTQRRAKRHYSDTMRLGRLARTLCGHGARSQRQVDENPFIRRKVQIADLPLCGSCERYRRAHNRSAP
jgi:hypothetical protein